MKCLAAFSSVPDILYIWKDDAFYKYIIELSVKNGIAQNDLSESFDVDDDVFLNYAGHFFYPLVTSNKYMKEMETPYKSIESENGYIFVLDEVTIFVFYSSFYCFLANCKIAKESFYLSLLGV